MFSGCYCGIESTRRGGRFSLKKDHPYKIKRGRKTREIKRDLHFVAWSYAQELVLMCVRCILNQVPYLIFKAPNRKKKAPNPGTLLENRGTIAVLQVNPKIEDAHPSFGYYFVKVNISSNEIPFLIQHYMSFY